MKSFELGQSSRFNRPQNLFEIQNPTSQMPYSNAKLEPTNKMIKDMKQQAFGFRNFKNFKAKIPNALNITKEETKFISSRA
ncbi:transposase [Streptococcus equi]|uniref:transposase n=1 Tax=Streptococcus equi TaxID=1336 RepID=UPI001E31C5A1|nr:transposase [Streptococcus equi]MCD3381617.1 transposase [Streptococcus equi subsp. zooepidemicus]